MCSKVYLQNLSFQERDRLASRDSNVRSSSTGRRVKNFSRSGSASESVAFPSSSGTEEEGGKIDLFIFHEFYEVSYYT